MREGPMKIKAPAKINLTLEVLSKRSDGYHEITSVIQTISLADTLEFRLAPKFVFSSDDAGWQAQKSLVPRAAALFCEKLGEKRAAHIHINKRIPFSAGLGGESSAAAAALRGLNDLFETGCSAGELNRLAASLGSDVPFFLGGGTALVTGRGEKVAPLLALPEQWVVLLIPPDLDLPDKTARMFSRLGTANFSTGAATKRFVSLLAAGEPGYSEWIYNEFDKVAEEVFPRIGWYKEQFVLAGAKTANLAGAGPVLFSLMAQEEKAGEIAALLKKRGFNALCVRTIGPGDLANLG
jgi:4-diphosphocytidyl-2-C-methyl-D-erythritol kinase